MQVYRYIPGADAFDRALFSDGYDYVLDDLHTGASR